MSNTKTATVKPKVGLLEIEATLATVAMACAELIFVNLPDDTDIDYDEVSKLKEVLTSHAQITHRPIAQVAAKMIAKEFGDHAPVSPILDVMETLHINKSLMEDAIETISNENHDATDVALVKAISKVFNIETGIGPSTKRIMEWAEGSFGVGMANAVSFAGHITGLLKSDEKGREKLAKLVELITKAALTHAPGEVKDKITEAGSFMGNEEAILMLWALWIEGCKQGVFLGWRSHEVAMLRSYSSHSLKGDSGGSEVSESE